LPGPRDERTLRRSVFRSVGDGWIIAFVLPSQRCLRARQAGYAIAFSPSHFTPRAGDSAEAGPNAVPDS
jgi:hypothetical protein